ncbi:fumarylacetoacetate hydrolase family protein [Leucobacter japonicus]|uniref:fumarylacetoacetate hydrolase family protein n=1 Tax=Leucobacter japonicus TaxID=1461259 RepID=UPI0006A7E771|nr:fumarylacetoacetate hydrolase family protein [Leucobacter japonicus]
MSAETAGAAEATVIPIPRPTLLDVHGSSSRFPVRRVYCVGRNYAAHSREMGHDPDREPPFFFTKPADAMIPCPESGTTDIAYPPATDDLHHEIELAVAIGATVVDVSASDALAAVWGYGVAIDLTRRDLQADAKALRRPWDLAKGFDQSGPISALVAAADIGHPADGSIVLDVDGERRQTGDLSQQIWSVAEVVAELSRSITLQPGDLILTGTPSGVGAVARGSRITAAIAGVAALDCRLV